jgi:DNA polymerase-3 subunit epsilon
MTKVAVGPYKGKNLLEMPHDFVVVDIETTGLKPEIDEIIEIGAIKVKNMEIIDTFQTLIKPRFLIPIFITNLTGISNKMVADSPSISEVLPVFMNFVDEQVLVGHNVNFDLNFIYKALMREFNIPLANDFVDTLRIAKRKLKNVSNYKLETLSHHFNINRDHNHRALKDCLMTFRVYQELMN